MTFGEKIKSLRQKKNLSQSDLGKLVEVHYSHIGRYEQNLSLPSVETLKKLAQTLGVSIDYLVFEDHELAVRVEFEDEDLLTHFKATEQLPADERVTVKKLIDAFLVKNQIKSLVK